MDEEPSSLDDDCITNIHTFSYIDEECNIEVCTESETSPRINFDKSDNNLESKAINSEPFTINNFPNEIIEKFTPDFSPKTICILKLVCKRFYCVFSTDRFHKDFLHYPVEYFFSDLKSDTTAHGVREVLDEIKSGHEQLWKGFIRLQKAHLDNWRHGRLDNVKQIKLPFNTRNLSITCVEEAIDDENEQWLLITIIDECSPYSPSISFVINVTCSKPLTLDETLIFKDGELVKLLPGMVIVESSSYLVYKLVKKTGEFTSILQHTLKVAPDIHFRNCSFYLSGRGQTDNTIQNLLIFSSWFRPLEIDVWDLKIGMKSKTVNLPEYTVIGDFVQNYSSNGSIDMSIRPGQFPFVVVNLRYRRVTSSSVSEYESDFEYESDSEYETDFVYESHSKKQDLRQITVFNVENDQFVYVVDECWDPPKFIIEYNLWQLPTFEFGMITKNNYFEYSDEHQVFKIYTLSPFSNSKAKLIYSTKISTENVRPRNEKVLFENGKTVGWLEHDGFHTVSMAHGIVHHHVTQISNLYTVLAVLKPGIILCLCWKTNSNGLLEMKSLDIPSGKPHFILKFNNLGRSSTDPYSLGFFDRNSYRRKMEYTSKLVTIEGNVLKIHNF